jgi:hypothetical protein
MLPSFRELGMTRLYSLSVNAKLTRILSPKLGDTNLDFHFTLAYNFPSLNLSQYALFAFSVIGSFEFQASRFPIHGGYTI